MMLYLFEQFDKNKQPIINNVEINKFREVIGNLPIENIKFKLNNNEVHFYIPKVLELDYKEYCYYFGDEENYFKTDNIIEIDFNDLNRIHFYDGLPYILRNTGLGYKLYSKLVFEFGYISTINGKNSKASRRVWMKLIEDDRFYNMINDERIIIIDRNNLEAIEKLRKPYERN